MDRRPPWEKRCVEAWESTVTLKNGEDIDVIRPDRFFPKRNKGKALLSGNVYCGHCGGRIFASTARRTHHALKTGDVVHVPIYKCYNRTQHKGVCDGPTTYVAEKVDKVVDDLIRSMFEKTKSINEADLFESSIQETKAQYAYKLKCAKAESAKVTRELAKWESLMFASIEGTCVFSPEQIKSRMDTLQVSAAELDEQIRTIENERLSAERITAEIREQHQKILNWAAIYDSASPEEKKIVASHLIKAVTLSRGYDIQVEFRINEAQFLGGMEMG